MTNNARNGRNDMTLTSLIIRIREHTAKHDYPPKGIMLTLPQLHDLYKSGREMMAYVNETNLNKIEVEGIPIFVEGDGMFLDLRNEERQ
jgi:hypothetical protein